MLQIRLSKGSAGDGGGAAAKPPPAVETVTVACPDHLVLADLPVAKSIGAVTSSGSTSVRSVGRRSRRHLGERVHFCVRCDFPIAIYGRLIPCEHAFCLTCARSDASCYLCEERIQKIQTIKIMEGIFICAAPHCLKSFLKRPEFESHIHENHADLLQPNAEREGGNGADARTSSTDLHKQSMLQEISTARAPPRSAFSPSSNAQLQDREERTRRHQSRDQPTPKPPLQPKPPLFHGRQQHQPGDPQLDNNPPPQGSDRPQNWIHQPQSFDNQSGLYQRRDSDQLPPDKLAGVPMEFSFSNYSALQLQPPQPPNYPIPVNTNPASMPPPSFSYPFPADGSQQFYSAPFEMPRPEMMPVSGSEQGSVLGFPPAPAGVASFAGSFPRPWGMGLVGMPSLMVGQGVPEGYMNVTDNQGRISEGLQPNHPQFGKELEHQGASATHSDGKGVLAAQPLSLQLPLPPPPPPPLPLPISNQLSTGNFSSFANVNQEGHNYGWQNDNRGFGNGPE
ncbi:E3 ubiquitin-protein ligase HAKAI homolog [Elaeis guineensis]|uniref:RING-type E3 ubiquitin transferase n=1 Tax=Elaeis guineensis var. tenera TaxID=51953 RepID=A0A6I9S0M2_ELAGV|nr:E3 ubiquitin-protein ligase HAKAI homolog [Elaeis guineensis]